MEPRRHLHLVGHKEVVQVAGDEPGRCGLTDHDVYHVLAVELATLPQEPLFPVVVVVFPVLKVPGKLAQSGGWRLWRYGPPREGPGALEYVFFGVVALTH